MRKITVSERQLVSYLLEQVGISIDIPEMILDMKDGGMGSISFDINETQKRANLIAGGTFLDEDGILVEFELTNDDNGNLLELDFWKVDFSKLISFPKLNEIKMTAPNNGYDQ